MIIACGDDESSTNSAELISSEDEENSNLGDEKKTEDLDDKSEDKEDPRKGTEYNIDGQAFDLKGFNIHWKGSGVDEIGYDEKTGRELIFISERYFRPAEVEELLGDSTKARKELGWKPQYSFDMLVKEMVEMDCK